MKSVHCSKMLGVTVRQQNNSDLALELYDEALFFIRQVKRGEVLWKMLEAEIFQNKANACKGVGKHQLAIRYSRKSISIYDTVWVRSVCVRACMHACVCMYVHVCVGEWVIVRMRQWACAIKQVV